MADKTKFKINLPVDQLVGGGFSEKLQSEMEKIFDNIHDPNTKATEKRVLTAKFTLAPDDDREFVQLDMDFTTKLAPVEGLSTRVLTEKDLATNTIGAYEFMSNQRGQTYIDDDGDLKADDGQPVDVIEKELQKKNNIHQLKRGNE